MRGRVIVFTMDVIPDVIIIDIWRLRGENARILHIINRNSDRNYARFCSVQTKEGNDHILLTESNVSSEYTHI